MLLPLLLLPKLQSLEVPQLQLIDAVEKPNELAHNPWTIASWQLSWWSQCWRQHFRGWSVLQSPKAT